jgi:hypothetical protein
MRTAIPEEDWASKAQILIVEGERSTATEIQRDLENLGYGVPAIAASGEEAIRRFESTRPDLLLTNIPLDGELDGIQAAEYIGERFHVPIIYLTNDASPTTIERAKATRPASFLLKPVQPQELYVAIEMALQQHRKQWVQEQEHWFARILRDMGDALIVVNRENRVLFFNLAAEQLTGWEKRHALHRDISEILSWVDERTWLSTSLVGTNNLTRMAAINPPSQKNSDRLLLMNREGIVVSIQRSIAPLLNEQGEVMGSIWVLRNVAQKPLIEESSLALDRAKELEQQIIELQGLHQLKDEFLGTVSHELRTPLASIRMAVQMLEIALEQQGVLESEAGTEPNRIVRYLEILRDQCNQELELVNDLLDLQRLNTEAQPLELTPIQLQNWIPHIVEVYQERARNRNQSLQVNISPNLPPVVSDVSKLTRILSELLNNACKYTPAEEKICVTVRAIATLVRESTEPSSQRSIQIRISNTGVEIPEQELSRIFDKFYRSVRGERLQPGGTGLGLTIVKKLVTILGGTIEAESGHGETAFMIELPLNPLDRSTSIELFI